MKRRTGLIYTILLALILSIQSCNSVKEITMQDLELLSTSAYSEFNKKEFLVINDATKLESIYNRFSTEAEVPKVDWEQHQVVLLALGMRNTGGYSIAIDSVSKTKSEILVYYKVTSPKPGDITTQALTAAYALYKIENKEKLSIQFQEVD